MVGIYPVDIDPVLALYQQRTGDMSIYENDFIKTDKKFDNAKLDAAGEFFSKELSLNRLNIKSVHINRELDMKMMYVKLGSIREAKIIFARVAQLAKDGLLRTNKVINYFPSIVYERKMAILHLLRVKRQTDKESKYQIRMEFNNVEVHRKMNGTQYFRRIPLTEITDNIDSLPTIGWKNCDYAAPRGRQIRQRDLQVQIKVRNSETKDGDDVSNKDSDNTDNENTNKDNNQPEASSTGAGANQNVTEMNTGDDVASSQSQADTTGAGPAVSTGRTVPSFPTTQEQSHHQPNLREVLSPL